MFHQIHICVLTLEYNQFIPIFEPLIVKMFLHTFRTDKAVIRFKLSAIVIIIYTGNMDMLIAAHAKAENLIVVTHNTREFEHVENLQLDDWYE